jgi:hypothetical protein
MPNAVNQARVITDHLSALISQNRVAFILALADMTEATFETLWQLIKAADNRSNNSTNVIEGSALIEEIKPRLTKGASALLIEHGHKFTDVELRMLNDNTMGRDIEADDVMYVLVVTREARQRRAVERVFSPTPPKRARSRRKAGD